MCCKWKRTLTDMSILRLLLIYKLFFALHTHSRPRALWFLALLAGLCTSVKLAAILQLSQYCTFDGDSISTVITEPGQPVRSSRLHLSSWDPSCGPMCCSVTFFFRVFTSFLPVRSAKCQCFKSYHKFQVSQGNRYYYSIFTIKDIKIHTFVIDFAQ